MLVAIAHVAGDMLTEHDVLLSAFALSTERMRDLQDRERLIATEIERDDKGFVKTGRAVVDAPAWKAAKRPPGPLETSRPGIFAAGDVRSGSVKRCAAAVGEGGMAVEGVHQALSAFA